MKPYRLFVGADFHCGHEVGLTPPKWNPVTAEPNPKLDGMTDYRATMWSRFEKALEPFRPFDGAILNGDLIDGRGDRIGGTEEVFVGRDIQADMAADVIRFIGAKENWITRGTDYHVGPIENWEDQIAGKVNAQVGDILKVDVNGVVFNARHHIGGSQVPHGRGTALLRDWMWDRLWADAQENYTKADVILRSHVHYCIMIQQPGILAMTTPGLQGYGTRYGERRLSGIIHFGFVVFNIANREDFSCKVKTIPFPLPLPHVAGSASSS